MPTAIPAVADRVKRVPQSMSGARPRLMTPMLPPPPLADPHVQISRIRFLTRPAGKLSGVLFSAPYWQTCSSFILFLPCRAIGVIHSISNVSDQFLNFPLIRRSHVTHCSVASGDGEVIVTFGNGEILSHSACHQEQWCKQCHCQ